MCFLIRKRRRPCRPRVRPRPAASSRRLDSSSSLSTRTNNSSTISLPSMCSPKELLSESGPVVFSFPEICASTFNFSSCQRIGRFAWKGVLRSSHVTIVQKHGTYSTHGFLRHLHFLHHANIVPLVGTCVNAHNVYFVYPSFEGTSLWNYLRGELNGSCAPSLSWHNRMQIALDVAKGLEYLHHLSFIPIVHRHIESRSILINHKMRAKIANIGLAQPAGDIGEKFNIHLQGTEKKSTESLGIQGIRGYMPPEYAVIGKESIKYDVFSFGVVLAEILSGREAVCSGEHEKALFLSDELGSLLKEPEDTTNKLRLWIDPCLQGSYPMNEAYQVAVLAALCVDPDPQSRPMMSYVTTKLQMHFLASESDQSSMIACTNSLLSGVLGPR